MKCDWSLCFLSCIVKLLFWMGDKVWKIGCIVILYLEFLNVYLYYGRYVFYLISSCGWLFRRLEFV